jgi:hypothetical protein
MDAKPHYMDSPHHVVPTVGGRPCGYSWSRSYTLLKMKPLSMVKNPLNN